MIPASAAGCVAVPAAAPPLTPAASSASVLEEEGEEEEEDGEGDKNVGIEEAAAAPGGIRLKAAACCAICREGCAAGCEVARTNRSRVVSCALLILSTALASGCFTAWQQVLPLMFAGKDHDANSTSLSSFTTTTTIMDPLLYSDSGADDKCSGSLWEKLSAREGDLLAFSSGVMYALGGPLAGSVADRYFVRRLKRLLSLSFLCLTGCFGLIVWAMPPPPWLLPPDGHKTANWAHNARSLGLTIVTISGLFAGAVVPPATELLAEDQLLSEGTSANLVMLLIQVFAFTTTLLVSTLSAPAMNVLMLSASGCCCLLCLPIKERYERRDADPNRESAVRDSSRCSSMRDSARSSLMATDCDLEPAQPQEPADADADA